MVKIMDNPIKSIKMDDLGGNTPIFGNTHMNIPCLKKMYIDGVYFPPCVLFLVGLMMVHPVMTF